MILYIPTYILRVGRKKGSEELIIIITIMMMMSMSTSFFMIRKIMWIDADVVMMMLVCVFVLFSGNEFFNAFQRVQVYFTLMQPEKN